MTDLDLLRKLAVKPGERIALLEPPAGYETRFAGPDHPLVPGEEGAASVAVLFAPDRAAFERGFDALTRAVRQAGVYGSRTRNARRATSTGPASYRSVPREAGRPSPRSRSTMTGPRCGCARSTKWGDRPAASVR